MCYNQVIVTIDQREYELEFAKYLAWERDALNRLYYGLWIVFLGGFVLSLHLTVGKHVRTTYTLIVLFRILAMVGSGINFMMQYHALNSVSKFRVSNFQQSQGRAALARDFQKQADNSDRFVARCEKPLQIVAVSFLIIAFIGSFFVTLP
jgi:hypothetical protein